MPLLFLTKNDAKLLKSLLEREKRRPPQPRDYPLDFPIHAPEVYLAKADGNITALQTAEEYGTGDEVVPGTGTADINHIVYNGYYEQIQSLSGLEKDVYSIQEDVIQAGQWMLLVRTKGGKWIAVPATTGSWRMIELITDLDFPGSASAYQLTTGWQRTDTTFTVYSSAAQHTGDGSTETGADGTAEGTGNTGIARYWGAPFNKWFTHAMSCDPISDGDRS